MKGNYSFEDQLKHAGQIISKAGRIVCFTGAGISTESGIPDFRSKGGLWSKYNPSEYATLSAFANSPEKFWTMHKELQESIQEIKPNAAHYALVKLEKMNKLHAIITQNIDNLHQSAGSLVSVLELHGNYRRYYCFQCGVSINYNKIEEQLKEGIIPPLCLKCGLKGVIKPDTILFGEQLPSEVFEQATNEVQKSDVCITIGSSLQVYPAALLPLEAYSHGAKLILVNKEPTQFDSYMSTCLFGLAGKILPDIVKEIERT